MHGVDKAHVGNYCNEGSGDEPKADPYQLVPQLALESTPLGHGSRVGPNTPGLELHSTARSSHCH